MWNTPCSVVSVINVRRFLIAASALVICLATPRPPVATPMFARKYKLPCSACHDVLAYPRLNDVGFASLAGTASHDRLIERLRSNGDRCAGSKCSVLTPGRVETIS